MANETKLQHLINPQVMADMVDRKLVDLMKFAPLAKIDNTLAGRPGDTISLPSYAYIGDATDVAELGAIPISELTASFQDVKVKKAGRGVKISDEAALSGYGDPIGEIAKQIAMSIASKLDNDALAVLDNATLIHGVVTVTPNEVNNALVKFGEDFEGDKYLFVSPATYAVLRAADEWLPASELAANIVVKGVVGEIYGCYVVVTNKITDNNVAYIVKPEAIALFLKRGTEIETARDIEYKATVFTGDKHYAAYLYDSSKAIKLGAATLGELTVTQNASIADGKAAFSIAGFPTNLSQGWKAFYATNLNGAVSVAVGDAFNNATGQAHASFKDEYKEGEKVNATNAKYYQVIYIDAAGKVRATGNATIATTIS